MTPNLSPLFWSLAGPAVKQPPHLDQGTSKVLISARPCDPPCVCDGWEICVHLFHGSGRIPGRPILSARSEEEKMEIVRGLQEALQPLVLLAFRPADGKEDPEHTPNLIDSLVATWAWGNNFRPDHRVVWPRGPEWLDSASHSPGQTWRTGGMKGQGCWE